MGRISIIIPTYNSSKKITVVLKSLLSQTFTDFEVIFVDDGSTDNTIDIIKKTLKDIAPFEWRILKTRHNGPGIARNIGIKKAKGEAIYFLDSDDTITSHAIAMFHKLLNTTHANVIVCSSKRHHEVSKIRSTNGSSFYGQDVLIKYLSGDIEIFMGNILIKKRFLLDNNIKFPSLKHGEDIVFISTVLSRADEVYIVPYSVHHYITNSDSLSGYKKASLSVLKEYKNALTSIAAIVEDDPRIMKALQQYRIPRGILSVLLQINKRDKHQYLQILEKEEEIRWYLSLYRLTRDTIIGWTISRLILNKKLREFIDILYFIKRPKSF